MIKSQSDKLIILIKEIMSRKIKNSANLIANTKSPNIATCFYDSAGEVSTKDDGKFCPFFHKTLLSPQDIDQLSTIPLCIKEENQTYVKTGRGVYSAKILKNFPTPFWKPSLPPFENLPLCI